MFLAECFLPAHKGMTKQVFGEIGGVFWSVIFVYVCRSNMHKESQLSNLSH